MMNWLRRIMTPRPRPWQPGEEILLYRSEEEDLERLLDAEEAQLREIMERMMSADDFELWLSNEPERRRSSRAETVRMRRQYWGSL